MGKEITLERLKQACIPQGFFPWDNDDVDWRVTNHRPEERRFTQEHFDINGVVVASIEMAYNPHLYWHGYCGKLSIVHPEPEENTFYFSDGREDFHADC